MKNRDPELDELLQDFATIEASEIERRRWRSALARFDRQLQRRGWSLKSLAWGMAAGLAIGIFATRIHDAAPAENFAADDATIVHVYARSE